MTMVVFNHSIGDVRLYDDESNKVNHDQGRGDNDDVNDGDDVGIMTILVMTMIVSIILQQNHQALIPQGISQSTQQPENLVPVRGHPSREPWDLASQFRSAATFLGYPWLSATFTRF